MLRRLAFPLLRMSRPCRTRKTSRSTVSIAYEGTEEPPSPLGDGAGDEASPKKRRSGASSAKKQSGPPADWRDQLALIERMRAGRTAAVDSMGTEAFLDPDASPEQARFCVFVAALLSSQTKDEVTAGAMARLKEHGLSIDSLLATEQATLAALLRPVGFFNNKAKYLRAACKVLRDEHGGDIPRSVDGLTALPGIGPKMAYLIMNVAWNDSAGICVDVHVHRICNRLGWIRTWNSKGKSQNPELTRKALEEWLPEQWWAKINPLLVGFGQEICLPVKPKCEECMLQDTCPAAKRGGKL